MPIIRIPDKETRENGSINYFFKKEFLELEKMHLHLEGTHHWAPVIISLNRHTQRPIIGVPEHKLLLSSEKEKVKHQYK